jgi:predicted DNA-binding protein (MmcQ/YjbR family)
MTLEYFRDFCLSFPGVSEDTPFDANTLCFRVGGKIFAILDLEVFDYVNLKCDPERAVELRERYPGISPGYHMNKKLWNSVSVGGNVPDSLILDLAKHSYELILTSLPKKTRDSLGLDL